MTTKVITYSAPSGGDISVTQRQAAILKKAGFWPRSPRGDEYCQVSYGLHVGCPTWTDAEVKGLILNCR